MMRKGSVAQAQIDPVRKRTRALDKFQATVEVTAPQKNTKIKWKPQVRVREYYKDGSVADVGVMPLAS